MEKIIVILWIVFGMYVIVLMAILLDLFSGISKAKKNGVIRSSYGYRRTVEKIRQYIVPLVGLTFMDILQMAPIWYMAQYHDKSYILFPFVTLVGAFGLCLIEVKSIYEKAENKVRIDDVGHLVGKILVNKDDLTQVVKEVGGWMKSDPEKTKTTITVETKQSKKEGVINEQN